MITASEPFEFVPHGRTVVDKHPMKIYSKSQNNTWSENSLLHKLTNFDIKDSFIEGTEEQESWIVREVCTQAGNFSDECLQSRYEKDECLSEILSRPQSRLKNDYNISIRSEINGGKKLNGPSTSRGGSTNSSSNMSKKFNLDCVNNPKKSKSNATRCCYEEELYVKGCTAVWSKGSFSTPGKRLNDPELRKIIACYTLDKPIRHAVFCSFQMNIDNSMLIDALNSQIGDKMKHIKIEDTTEHIPKQIMPCILLIEHKCMRVYDTGGKEFVTSIPFQVKRVWPMKYGVLLEKNPATVLHTTMVKDSLVKFNTSKNTSVFSKSKSRFNMSTRSKSQNRSFQSESGKNKPYVALPICFSVGHPLDEVTPVLMKPSSLGCQYYNDPDLEIIFVSSDPSIILIYDWKLFTYSLWTIRKALREESLAACPKSNMSMANLTQSICEFPPTGIHSHLKNSSTPNVTKSGSFVQSKKGKGAPTPKNQSKANILANMPKEQMKTPNTSTASKHGMSSFGKLNRSSVIGNKSFQHEPLPLYPDICFDHIWTDSQTIRRDVTEESGSKTFLHTDMVGHSYLCFIVKFGRQSKLQIVRLQKSHSHGQRPKSNLIVGSITSLTAKDAVPLEHLNMMALIDDMGNIVLHSGTLIVGKVHVGGVLARLIDSPYTKPPSFQSPFPRRSSLLPSRAADAAAFDVSAFHHLSPVPHAHASRIDADSIGLQGLRDPAGNCITLQFDKGSMYRITLPEVYSSALVAHCCDALRAVLPRDVSLQVLVKWYGVRNTPGSLDLSPEEEWSMFVNMLYSLIGYNLEKLFVPKNVDDQSEVSEVVTKKQRTSSDGTQDDWDYLLNSRMHKSYGDSIALVLNLKSPKTKSSGKSPVHKPLIEEDKSNQFNGSALLLPYSMNILFAFHLVYEDMKLNTLLLDDMQLLSKFLYQLAKDIKLEPYMLHYWTDLPHIHDFEYDESDSQMSEQHLKKLNQPSYFSEKPPHLFAYLNSIWKDEDVGCYPYLAEANDMSRNVIEFLATVGCGRGAGVQRISGRDSVMTSSTPRVRLWDSAAQSELPYCRGVRLLCQRGVTPRDVDNMPPAVCLYVMMVLTKCRADPPLVWPRECYEMVMRDDLALLAGARNGTTGTTDPLTLEVIEKESAFTYRTTNKANNMFLKIDEKESEVKIGMEHLDTKLLRLLYPDDNRMLEVVNSFQSSVAVNVNLMQMAEVSDHDFADEQQKHVFAYATRTMCLPMARGMLTLRTLPWLPVKTLHLPKLDVSGRGPKPRYMHIELNTSAGGDPPHCLSWPNFHNGVAAGLAILPSDGKTYDSNWITFHKPKGAVDMSSEHAGFILGLGLNGHLKNMPNFNIYDLLRGNEMISVGVLLGLAATHRGAMSNQAMKVLSIHLEAFLPTTSIELDIQQNVQNAAMLGVGLVYQGTRNTHYGHVLLGEIGKPPGPEMEKCTEREGYSLAAGLSLGLVFVGAGNDVPPSFPQALRTYMLGGDKQPVPMKNKDKNKQGSFAIREGDIINLDVTAPGATLALALIYLNTGNKVVSSWLEPPDTYYMLDFVRPDLLMLRCIAKSLINWSEIEPESEWVEKQIPESIKPYCFVKPNDDVVDYETMNQTYCNIAAGACFAVGLRFAGTGHEDARDTILHYVKLFIALSGKSVGELSGKSTLETCLCVCLLAAGMVMAGRGDVTILRICRRMRDRLTLPTVSPRQPALTHGGQMAVHLTMGLLFMGGGRLTLGTSPAAVAALLIAFFPKFPIHSEDNRYHLQAFRHLYVLAAEPRLLLPRELTSGQICYAHVQVVDLEGVVHKLQAPCMLPELETLREVRINDPRFCPVVFHRDLNWDQLRSFLANTDCVDIKPRSGFLSYLEDRNGLFTILSETLTLDKSNIWAVVPDMIELFTSEEKTLHFINNYLINADHARYHAPKGCLQCLVTDQQNDGLRPSDPFEPRMKCQCRSYWKEDIEFVQNLNIATYECVVKDMMCVLPIWITFLKILRTLPMDPSTYDIWQIKLLVAQLEDFSRQNLSAMNVDDQDAVQCEPLISNEYALAIIQKVEDILDSNECTIFCLKKTFLGLPKGKRINSCPDQLKKTLGVFVAYYDMPKDALKGVECGSSSPLALLAHLEGLDLKVSTLNKINELLNFMRLRAGCESTSKISQRIDFSDETY